MLQIQSEVEINASARRVWEVLTDLAAYPEWTSWQGTISGEIREGARLKVLTRPRRGKMQLNYFRVIRVVPEKELRWTANYVPWLLRGERYWVLKSKGVECTLVVQGEAYMGLLAPLLRRHVQTQGLKRYDEICAGLKRRCEK